MNNFEPLLVGRHAQQRYLTVRPAGRSLRGNLFAVLYGYAVRFAPMTPGLSDQHLLDQFHRQIRRRGREDEPTPQAS